MPTDSHIVSAVSQTEPTREYDECSDVLFQFDLIKGDIPRHRNIQTHSRRMRWWGEGC